MNIKYNVVNNLTDKQKIKLDKAVAHLKYTLSSPLLYPKVMNATFIQNDGYNNSDIYKLITENDWEFDCQMVYVSPFKFWLKNVVAWVNMGEKTINFNSRIFCANSIQKVAGTIAHEYMHILGFKHDSKPTKGRDDSVPYKIGKIISEV